MSAPLIPTLRLGVFAFVTFASIIVLALCAHVTNTTTTLLNGYFAFAALGIATAVLAFLTLPVMLVVDNVRKGAFTSMILVEIAWLGLLWILFLSTAATASSAASVNFPNGCSSRISIYTTTCHEFSAIEAFAHLAWIVLFAYVVALITFSVRLANRGYDKVWYQSVKDTEFNAPPVNAAPVGLPTQQFIPVQTTGVYPQQGTPVQATPVQGSPAPGWAGSPQPTPVAAVHAQQA